jgi:streptomycin 6-kinase
VLDGTDPGGILARRVAVLAEVLGFERQRVARWGVAAAVLSAWWSVEDLGEADEGVLRVAALLNERAR